MTCMRDETFGPVVGITLVVLFATTVFTWLPPAVASDEAPGVTYNVYGDPEGMDRLLTFDGVVVNDRGTAHVAVAAAACGAGAGASCGSGDLDGALQAAGDRLREGHDEVPAQRGGERVLAAGPLQPAAAAIGRKPVRPRFAAADAEAARLC